MFSGERGRRRRTAVKMGHAASFVSRKIGDAEFIIEVLILRKIFGIDMNELGFAEVCDAEFTKDVVDDGCGEFDGAVVRNGAGGFEAREDKRIHVFFERDAVLQAQADCDGKAVHEASEGGAFLVHIDENFAE